MIIRNGLSLILTALAAATLFAFFLAGAQPARAATTCPDFTILHDDRIDGVSLPHGRYGVTVFSGVSCQDTTRLLQKFLQQGRTSDGWKINSKAVFTKGSQSWQIKQGGGGGGGGGGGDGGRNVCPDSFRVLHNDRIGELNIPAGSYRITTRRISCADATNQFRRFLQYPGGNLPDNWKVRPLRAKFRNAGTGASFRIKRLGG